MIIDSPIISGSHAASGSLNQTGDVVITGSLTVTGTINASITGSITSASYASYAETLDGLDSTSFTTTSSFNTASGSFSTRVTDLETASGSFSTRVTNNESTGSSLTTASGSFSTRVTNNEATGSSLVTASGSFSTRTTNLETASGSFSTRVTNTEATASSLVTASGSFSTRTTNLETASGSFSTRVTSAEGSVSSLNNKSGSYATTGSNNFNGNQVITGSLTTTGTITAQTLNVQQVTSSIVYSSGSNIFGNSVSNTQQFTGSLQVSSSTSYILGNVGLGTTSPATILHLQQSSGPTIRLVRSSNRFDITGDTDFMELNARDASTYMIFKTADIERIRITSGGDIAVGSTSTRLSGGSTNSTFLTLTAKASGANALLELNGIRTGNGDYSGYVRFFNNSGATPIADIQAIRGSSDVSGSLAIATSGTERMRITSTGEIGIGVTPTAGNAFWVKGRSTSSGDTAMLAQNSDGTNLFYVLNNGTVIMPNGNVGIGTTNVPFGLSVYRASIGQGDTSTNLLLFDTTSYATGVGGGISFGGYYDSSNSEIYTYGYVKGGKENSTNGNFAGYLSFGTRAQSAGSSAERMRITSGGNILLGTSSEYGPGFKLQINGSAYITGIVYSNSGFYINSGQYTGITEAPYTGIYMTNSSSGDGFGALLVTSRTDIARPIIFGTSNGSTSVERMRISSGGNVGIGTTSPLYKLDVNGIASISTSNTSLNAQNSAFYFNNTYPSNYALASISYGTEGQFYYGYLAFNTITTGFANVLTERMRITQAGNVGIGTTNPNLYGNGFTNQFTVSTTSGYANISVAGSSGNSGGIDFGNQSVRHAGVYGLDGSDLGFYTNGSNSGNGLSERMRITSGGKVGINNTSPNNVVDIYDQTYNSNTVGVLAARTRGGGTFITGRVVTAEVSNQTQTIATMSSSGANERIFIKVQVVNVSAVNNYGNVHVGYALWSGSGGSSVTTMTLDSGNSNISNTSVGTLSWSGNNLQYTTNRIGNYELNAITIWASARDTGLVS